MQFREHNLDDGIELHLNVKEREIIYNALRHYAAYGKDEMNIIDHMPIICEIQNVLMLPEYIKEP